MTDSVLRGRVWRFGDNVNTDIISPAEFMGRSFEEIGEHVFDRVSPGFARKIERGDFVVAGENFGSGSSRETAQIALRYAGVGAVIAKSFARIFFRNCINVGLPVMTFADTDLLAEGSLIEIDLTEGRIRDLTERKEYVASRLPEHIMKIVSCSGLKNYLREYVKKGQRKLEECGVGGLKKGKALRERLAQERILVAPGAHDVLTAKIVEATGFEAVYMTGYGTTASILGSPDVGLLTMTEMAARAACMSQAVNIPVIADADVGYGNVVNVTRTVREYERAGVACMQLEDQVMPKKCGHMLGRQIVPMNEMVGKIRAAVDTRSDPDEMLIMARTDARTDHGMEETLRRGHAYEKAGADILFIESLENEDEMRTVTSAFGVPVLANMLEHGRTPLLSASQLEEIGYDLVIYCVSSTYVAAKAVWDLMQNLKDTGTTAGMIRQMITFEDFNKLVGLPEIRRIEREYHSGRNIVVEDGK